MSDLLALSMEYRIEKRSFTSSIKPVVEEKRPFLDQLLKSKADENKNVIQFNKLSSTIQNYIYYWNEDFKSLYSKKIKVKVRFDPFNIGVAYAYVNKRWVKCISEYYAVFKNMTEKEFKF